MNLYDYYSAHSITTDPKKYSYLYDSLTSDIPKLCQIVQDLIMHYADEDLLRYYIPKNRYSEMDIRFVAEILNLLNHYDDRPLDYTRNTAHRMIGVCRDTSVLLCSILRHKNIPARLRVGFCPYFIPGIYLDGMCVEYWDSILQRWRLVDTRTSDLHIKKFKLHFNFSLYDIPSELFISAAQAWQLCRSHKLDANLFGSRLHRGLRFIQDRLIQELAVLNKKEVLLWDRWGMMLDYSKSSPCNDKQLSALDELSAFILKNAYQVENLQKYYNEHSEFRIDHSIVIRNPFTDIKTIAVNF